MLEPYAPEDFLIVFRDTGDMLWVMQEPYPPVIPFKLLFKPWRCESMAVAAPMKFRVLITIRSIRAHVWLQSTTEKILQSSYEILALSPDTRDRVDFTRFELVAWCVHPSLIPKEKILVVPEEDEPFVESAPPLFLKQKDLIHTKRHTLRYRVIVFIHEVQDMRPRSPPSSSDGSPDSDDDDYPGYTT